MRKNKGPDKNGTHLRGLFVESEVAEKGQGLLKTNMAYITPMYETMRKLSGRMRGGLRKTLEAKRRELSRYGMTEMNAMLGQWVDPELFSRENKGSDKA